MNLTKREKKAYEKAKKQVEDWNSKYPPGTEVTRYKLIKPLREPMETKSRSIAWIIGGNAPVVAVEGITGGVLLESLVVKE